MMIGDTVRDTAGPDYTVVWDGSLREQLVTVPELDAHRRTGDRFVPVASRRENLGMRYDTLQAPRQASMNVVDKRLMCAHLR